MRIGTLQKQKRNRINFKDYIKKYWIHGTKKELKIIRIFLPGQYNSFTLICLDLENSIEVSRSLSPSLGKELCINFKLSRRSPRQGTLYLIIDEEGNQDIVAKEDDQHLYLYEKNSFALRHVSTIPVVEDDIPF